MNKILKEKVCVWCRIIHDNKSKYCEGCQAEATLHAKYGVELVK